MALNCLFCADMLRPLDVVPLIDFAYKYLPCTTHWIVWTWTSIVGGRLSRLRTVF